MYFPGNYSKDHNGFYFTLGFLFSSCIGHTSFFSSTPSPDSTQLSLPVAD